jgi:hypothetical protein
MAEPVLHGKFSHRTHREAPASTESDQHVEVEGTSLLHLDGSEVLDVLTEEAPQVLAEPVPRFSEVRVPHAQVDASYGRTGAPRTTGQPMGRISRGGEREHVHGAGHHSA